MCPARANLGRNIGFTAPTLSLCNGRQLTHFCYSSRPFPALAAAPGPPSSSVDPAPQVVKALAHPLPALRHDAAGRPRIDYRAVIALAAPLFLNSSIQAVLNLTDTWFLGHISTDAVAAVGAV